MQLIASLLCCRSNAQVYSSQGPDGKRREYPGAVGSAVRRHFKKLPGVGAQTARRWYEMGFRWAF